MTSMVWVYALTLGSAMAVFGWVLTAGPLRLFTRASRCFIGFNGLVMLAALSWWPWGWFSSIPPAYRLAFALVLMLAAFLWLCHGLHVLNNLKPTYVLAPFMGPCLTVLMVGVAWLDDSGTGPWMVFFSASVWVLGVTVQQAFPSLMVQGGVGVARWSLTPLAAVAVLWLAGMVCTFVLGLLGAPAAGFEGAELAHLSVMASWQLSLLLTGWGLMNGGLLGLMLLKLVDKIRELNTEDELTGALNFRSFLALLNAERERLRRTRQAQSLLVCEVDQFHALNKQLGFAAGDAALRHVTGVLGRGLRKTDRLGRSQNAELLMFLPATPVGGAILVAERTQAAVKSNPLLWNGQSINLSLSIGAGGREDESMSCEMLLNFCSQAVRRAQNEGGGRIRAAQYDEVALDIVVSGFESEKPKDS